MNIILVFLYLLVGTFYTGCCIWFKFTPYPGQKAKVFKDWRETERMWYEDNEVRITALVTWPIACIVWFFYLLVAVLPFKLIAFAILYLTGEKDVKSII